MLIENAVIGFRTLHVDCVRNLRYRAYYKLLGDELPDRPNVCQCDDGYVQHVGSHIEDDSLTIHAFYELMIIALWNF
jgi:hypothetical protein